MEKKKAYLKPEVFNEYRLKLAAAGGDYGEADAALADLIDSLQVPPPLNMEGDDLLTPQQMGALSVVDAVSVGEAYPDLIVGLPAASIRWLDFRERLDRITVVVQKRADLTTLRGLLALEAGDAAAAEGWFREAVGVWAGPEAARTGAGVDFAARPVAQLWLERLTAAGR
jgi:hypothetical protein